MKSNDSNSVLVMVVDDQFGSPDDPASRISAYKVWLQKIRDLHTGKWSYDIQYCFDITDVAKIVAKPGQPLLAIVDMVLEGDAWSAESVTRLDQMLSEQNWPLIFVSGKFGDGRAIERVNSLVRSLKVHVPFHLFTWTEIQNVADGTEAGNHALIVDTVLGRANDQDIQFNKMPDDPIDIVHITDTHFGKAHWDIGALIKLRHLRESKSLSQADFLAITGDIANRCLPSEYEQAAAYFAALAHHRIVAKTEAGLSKHRVFLCPGNHDFSRPLALAANISGEGKYVVVDKEIEENGWIRRYSWAPYYEFETRIAGHTRAWVADPGYRINATFATAGLLVLELNVERYGIKNYQEGFTETQLRNAINAAVSEVDRIRKPSDCVLVLAHRDESEQWSTLAQMIQTNLDGLATPGPLIFLCGHEHNSEVRPFLNSRGLLVRGGPPVKGPPTPEGTLPVVNCVRLKRAGGVVSGVKVHQFHLQATTWLESPDSPVEVEYRGGKWRT